jgi:hypothetical protein
VASTVTSGSRCSSPPTTSSMPAICSTLSRQSSTGRPLSRATTLSSVVSVPSARPPVAAWIIRSAWPASAASARGTKTTSLRARCRASAASVATRVLPIPPTPVRVTRREDARWSATRSSSGPRPTVAVGGVGTGAPTGARSSTLAGRRAASNVSLSRTARSSRTRFPSSSAVAKRL